MAKRYILTSEIARVKAKHAPFELQLPAGEVNGAKVAQKVITIPAMQTLPDDVVLYSNTQPVRAAKILLGEDYDQFVAGGGTSQLLFVLLQDHAGADLGE